MSPLLFYPLAALTLAGALGVVVARNPVRGAMSLVATLFLVAVFYAGLGAHLVAALQIIVYAGAVMVLFLFVIMLLGADGEPPVAVRKTHLVATLVAGSVLAAGSVALLAGAFPEATVQAVEGFGGAKALGRVLLKEHIVAFELTSVFLLVAVVGAVVMAGQGGTEER
ncbi:MAG: NADH-quinone oxidoreductase subunit J [Deltaproteobacteria bacterium]